jgi:hypothetical protein
MDYNPETGVFVRKVQMGSRGSPGATVGTKSANGYLRTGIDGRDYTIHWLAWLFVYGVWPKYELDHKNRIKTDNRIENLRDVSRSVNEQNRVESKVRKYGETGVLGVYQDKRSGAWYSRIGLNKKSISLGSFYTEEEAAAAYIGAKKILHMKGVAFATKQ